jgi:hypothetical protein
MLNLSSLPPYPPVTVNKLGRVRVMTDVYSDSVLAHGKQLLEATAKACVNDGCRERVQFASLGLQHAQLLRDALLSRRANER